MQKYGGISRYFANLHRTLPSYHIGSRLGVFCSNNHYIENQFFGKSLLENSLLKKDARKYKWNKWYSRLLIQQSNFDVFHPTYYHSYFLKSLRKPFVLTVHDMIHELFPQYFIADPYKGYKEQVLQKADHIIAISESTKRDIQRFYSIPDKKITVIHHGYIEMTHPNDTSLSFPKGKYILFVGERRGYKNFNLLLKTISSFLKEANLTLVCAGGNNFTSEEKKLVNELRIAKYVRQLNVTDAQLTYLYQNALLFVFPTLYEGFGLPVLEAFKTNCPIVMSNRSSLPEVGGEAARYFDPYDQQSITTAIIQVAEDSSVRRELIEKGRERLKEFTFASCAAKTIEVYSSIL